MESKTATMEDLFRILTRYEGAVQRADEGDDESQQELEEARQELMKLLEQAK